MAYIDDLDAPRARRRPVMTGVPTPTPLPSPVSESYQGPSPVGIDGNPNEGYTGNTGIRPPRIPPVVQPPIDVPPPPRVPAPPPAPPPTPPPPPAVATTGAAGGQAVPRPPTTPPPTTPAPPAQPSQAPTTPQGVGPYAVEADQGKLNSGHDSPMYRMLRLLSNFDPRKGVTPDVIAALNQLGLGTFSADGNDKVRISGNVDPRWDGVTEWDVVKGFNTGNGVWVGQGLNGRAAEDYAAAVAAQQAAAPTTAPGTNAAGGGGSSTTSPGASSGGLSPVSGTLGGTQGVNFGITGPFGYDDPNTRQLEEFLRLLIDDKTKPIDDPARNEYANALRQRFLSITAPGSGVNTGAADLDQQLQEAIAALQSASPYATNPAASDFDRELQTILGSLKTEPAYTRNAGADAFDQQLQDAINQLTNPALTANDRSRLENRALEPLERDRQIRIQQQKERLAAMGHGESSGTIADVLSTVDQDFDRRRGEVQRDLSIYEREQDDARRREAIGYGSQRRDVLERELERERAAEAARRGEITSLSGQRMTAAEREIERQREIADSRRQEAIGLGTQRRDVLQTELDRERSRSGEALTMAEALSNLSGQQRGEQDARMREALTYVSLFPEMDERRLRLAMETLGMSSGMANGQSIFNTLSNLQAQANAAQQQGQQQNAAFWNSMGQWMAQNFGTGG